MTAYLPLLPLLDGIRVEAPALQLFDHDFLLLVLHNERAVALLQDEARQVVLPLLVVLQPLDEITK